MEQQRLGRAQLTNVVTTRGYFFVASRACVGIKPTVGATVGFVKRRFSTAIYDKQVDHYSFHSRKVLKDAREKCF